MKTVFCLSFLFIYGVGTQADTKKIEDAKVKFSKSLDKEGMRFSQEMVKLQKKMDKTKEDFKAFKEKEKSKVLRAYKSEFSRLAKKGELEEANKLLAEQKEWEKMVVEGSGIVVKEDYAQSVIKFDQFQIVQGHKDQTNTWPGVFVFDGSNNNAFKFKADAPSGKWYLHVYYASNEKRPVKIQIGSKLVTKNALNDTTGGFFKDDCDWESLGPFTSSGKTETIMVSSRSHAPHIRGFVLSPKEDPPEGDPFK